MVARILRTVIYPVLTGFPLVLLRTVTAVRVDSVQAGPAMHTRSLRAVVNVSLTVFTLKAGPAVALEVVDERLAPPAVLALVSVALVYLHLAPLTAEARLTLAEVIVHPVQTRRSVLTRLMHPTDSTFNENVKEFDFLKSLTFVLTVTDQTSDSCSAMGTLNH